MRMGSRRERVAPWALLAVTLAAAGVAASIWRPLAPAVPAGAGGLVHLRRRRARHRQALPHAALPGRRPGNRAGRRRSPAVRRDAWGRRHVAGWVGPAERSAAGRRRRAAHERGHLARRAPARRLRRHRARRPMGISDALDRRLVPRLGLRAAGRWLAVAVLVAAVDGRRASVADARGPTVSPSRARCSWPAFVLLHPLGGPAAVPADLAAAGRTRPARPSRRSSPGPAPATSLSTSARPACAAPA